MPSNETSKNPTRSREVLTGASDDSENLSENPERNSVYEFLYHDVARVASFLAQFETYGVLLNTKATEIAGRSTTTKGLVSAKGGVPLIAEGQASLDRGVTAEELETAERSYDPLWANAKTFLDYLESESLLQRGLSGAKIGQFVLVSGELSVLQLTLLKSLWTGPGFKEKAIETQIANAMAALMGASQMAASAGAKKNQDQTAVAKQTRANALAGMELIASLPHTIQATIQGNDTSVWCVLAESALIPAASDITLKYGSLIMPGTWHALGILDAMPSPIPEQVPIVPSEKPVHIGPVLHNISNLARTLMGRPPEAYGLTPLLLFREVTA
jgi:hypothetical protein